jgi:prepilin-type N-terminal cleavage/methylation domain-containing protein
MRQRGFSLVEISIVLVIIGMILGGILSSQSLIRSGQAKDVVAIVDDLRTAAAYFKQRYHYLPGDFPVNVGDIANVAPPGGNGDGAIDGAVDAATGQAAAATDEVAQAPWQLFSAGFLGKTGSDPLRRITTSFGAVHLVSTATANGLAPGFTAANPAARNAIAFFNLPCDIVMEVDNKVDDGVLATGRGFATAPCVSGAIVQWYIVVL